MTDKQKEQIRQLHANGYGYRKIASAIDIPIYTVKSYCRRLTDEDIPTQPTSKADTDRCPVCYKKLVHISGRKKKRFCSDACRMKWWNNHKEQLNHEHIKNIACVHCGKTFSIYENSQQKYCSHACYIKERFGGKNAAE